MRYGIISDIHGNLEALNACVAALSSERIGSYVCLGDVVGYGARPEECAQVVRALAQIAIVGNHDAAACGRMGEDYYYDDARKALRWTKKQITRRTSQWLAGLPFRERVHVSEKNAVRAHVIEFCHSSPLVPEDFDYVFDTAKVKEIVEGYPDLADVTFIGHTHLTRCFSIDVKTGTIAAIKERSFVLEENKKYIITAGSVGQPRDYDPRACCCIYDSSTCSFSYMRVEYDASITMQQIIDAGLSYQFGARLLVGI